jgi:bacterioferritin-associated ferredoxin
MSRAWVCRCEDVDLEETEDAIAAGHDDLESLRRYTAIGTGPCQGKACIAETIRLLAKHHGVPEGVIGQATLRPPHTPLLLGALAALDPAAIAHLAGERVEADGPEAAAARTGRPTPDSVERSLALHRGLLRGAQGRDGEGMS